MILQYLNFNWIDFWYSSSFDVTRPSSLGCSTFSKQILPITIYVQQILVSWFSQHVTAACTVDSKYLKSSMVFTVLLWLLVSHHFGYGLLDVAAMVDVARNWTRVPEQHRCEITSRHASRSANSTHMCTISRQHKSVCLPVYLMTWAQLWVQTACFQ